MNSLNLKFILEAVDKLTAPIRRIRDGAVGAFQKMRDGVRNFGDSLQFKAHFQLLLMEERLKKVSDAAKKLGRELSQAGQFFSKRLTLPIAGFGALAIRSAGNVEQMRESFKDLIGDGEKAARFMDDLLAFSSRSPFSIEDTSEAARAMLAAGYSTEETAKRMQFLGNVAAGSKNTLADITQLYMGLRLKGKADAGDLAGMVRSNIPIVMQLSKQLGVSQQRVYQLAAAGDISFAQVKKALQDMGGEGGRFANKMENYGRTIFGVFDELKKAVTEALAVIGADLYRDLGIGDKVKAITGFVRDLAKAFMALPAPVKNFITWTALLAALLGPVLFVIGQVVVAFGLLAIGIAKVIPGLIAIGGIFSGIGKFFVALVSVVRALLLPALAAIGEAIMAIGAAILATPIGWIILGIAALAGAGYLLVKNWGGVKAFFVSMWDGIKNAFGAAIDWIGGYINKMLDGLSSLLGGLQSIKAFVTDNAVTRGWDRLFGDGEQGRGEAAAGGEAGTPAPAAATPAGILQNKVDAGGIIKIQIDAEGQPRVTENRANDSGIQYSVNTGLLMGSN